MDKIMFDKLKHSTPTFAELREFEDADDEMLDIASYIKKTTQHNKYIEPKRIKFLYTNKPKKDGGRFTLFDLVKRSNLEKMITDQYDFILTTFYDVWKDLEPEQKLISLDKALCAIDIGDIENQKIGKKAPDSKEYTANMKFFGAEKVMNTSEIIDLACQRIIETRKEEEKEIKMRNKMARQKKKKGELA